ncbi:hypothetical protein Acr_26g0002270 [Actinidia rufa]|uniref:Uncharacterized protein n=1 Tax=Actinidia rufa TaxID=165716 RepID=A0A7J0H1H1_9ERIC|nr:hypothetical protein Acr_26g0002270 [Actinidia rufa]
MEEAVRIASEQVKDNKMRGASSSETTSKTEAGSLNQKTSSVTEQDLDVFLLGDLGDSDDGPGITISSS